LSGNGVTLAVNCGSSSVKIAIFDADFQRIGDAEASRIATDKPVSIRYSGFGEPDAEELSAGSTHDDAISHLSQRVGDLFGDRLEGIGHRVVHGGEHYSEPRRIDAELLSAIQDLAALAPLHQPHNLTGIRLFGERFRSCPRLPASTLHFTAPFRKSASDMGCRPNMRSGAFALTGSMACPAPMR
jgi:acetate kinase